MGGWVGGWVGEVGTCLWIMYSLVICLLGSNCLCGIQVSVG